MERSFTEVMKELAEKKDFVEGALQALVRNIYPFVTNVIYTVTPDEHEVVIVHTGIGIIRICVDCDSKQSIVRDVLRRLDG